MELLALPKVIWAHGGALQELNARDLTLDLALALREAGSHRMIEKLSDTSFKTSISYDAWMSHTTRVWKLYHVSLIEVASDSGGHATTVTMRSPGVAEVLERGGTSIDSSYQYHCNQDLQAVRQHFEGKPLHDGFRLKADRFRELWQSMPSGVIVDPPTDERAQR